jgi:hypothetical protein
MIHSNYCPLIQPPRNMKIVIHLNLRLMLSLCYHTLTRIWCSRYCCWTDFHNSHLYNAIQL